MKSNRYYRILATSNGLVTKEAIAPAVAELVNVSRNVVVVRCFPSKDKKNSLNYKNK